MSHNTKHRVCALYVRPVAILPLHTDLDQGHSWHPLNQLKRITLYKENTS